MSLDRPVYLLLLLLVPLVVLLHTVRTRRRRVVVSSVLLWQAAIREHDSVLRIRRILRNLVLLLQIAIVLLTVLGLAGPNILGRPTHRTDNVILILDATASMQTTLQGTSSEDRSTTRFEEAARIATDIVDGLKDGARVMLIQAGAFPRLRTAFVADHQRVKRLIHETAPTDEAGGVTEALLMALALADPNRGDEIFLISDGAFELPGDVGFGRLRVTFIQIGDDSRNVGITRFKTRSVLGYENRFETMVAVENFSEQSVPAEIVYTVNNEQLAIRELLLEPFEQKTIVYRHAQRLRGRAIVELKVEDDFDVDNRAFAVFTQAPSIRVLLITPGNVFLQNVLAALPFVVLEISSETAFGSDEQSYDVVIYDRMPALALRAGGYLLVDTIAPNVPLEPVGTAVLPRVGWWERDHPVLADVALDKVTVLQATVTAAGRGPRVIAQADDTDLIYAHETQSFRVVYLGFDLLQSDLPLKIAFPIMVSNTLQWLSGEEQPFSVNQVSAGSAYTIPVPKSDPLPAGDRQLKTIYPDGGSDVHEVEGRSFVFGNTSQVGFYVHEIAGQRRQYAVSLVNRDESNIKPRFGLPTTDAQDVASPATGVGARSKREIWIWFIVLALGIVLAEWGFWLHERAREMRWRSSFNVQ